MNEKHHYRVFGLCIQSELALPELFGAPGDSEPDVFVTAAPIPDSTNEKGPNSVPGGALLVVPKIARYLVSDGARIVVEAVPGVPARNVRLYLLGSTLGMLLHQRGLLPLHANAIEVDGRAIAFLGPSGAGKSTLAMRFHDLGLRVIADDICVIRQDSVKGAFVSPGLPRFRLWQEALNATGRSAIDYERSYVGDETFDKFDIPIGPESASERDVALEALYILEQGDVPKIEPLRGIEAIEAVFANTYRGGYLGASNGHRNHWSSVVELVGRVPAYRFTRPMGFGRLDEDCNRVLEHLRTADVIAAAG